MEDIFSTEIPEMNLLGNGIVKIDGCVVFVMGAVDGDVVTARITQTKKNYKIAEIVSIDRPSPHRIASDCPVSGECGGCCLRHISYEHEAEIKRKGVEAALRRGGLGELSVPDIIVAEPERYRNKAVFRFDGEQYGFSEEKTDRIVPTEDCLICPEIFSSIAEYCGGYFAKNPLSYLYLRRSSIGEISCVAGKKPGVDYDISAFAVNLTERFPQVVGVLTKEGEHPEDGKPCRLVSGKDTVTESFLGMELEISPDSFFQVNHDAAEALCAKAAEYAAPDGDEFGIDLYCGTGVIGLSVAALNPSVHVTGVEINPAAVENAKQNASRNSLSNIGFFCGDSAVFAKQIYGSADFITIDPPRAGCSDQMIKELLRLKAKRLVYVSCDPATLARDLGKLTEKTYSIEEVCAVDLFPRTKHVETVVLLSRA